MSAKAASEEHTSEGEDLHQWVAQAISSPSTTKEYFNGSFPIASNSDIMLILSRSGEPRVVLNCSYETAKYLAKQLTMVIDDMEKQFNCTFPSMEDMSA